MINLLPPDAKAEIHAGRANRLLVRYLFLFTGLMILLFASIAASIYIMMSTKAQAIATIDEANKQSVSLHEEQQKVTQFISDLKIAKQILGSQTNYSTILLRIASIIPSGVTIDNLSLDSSNFTKPVTITAHAKDDAAALALKNALTSSDYFTNPHFSTLATSNKGAHPITIEMDVTFTKELFK
jgi:Fimbrial assembly protein (PilN).